MSKNSVFNSIKHSGKIISISNNLIEVEIVNTSMCATCHAKGACGAQDSIKKTIEIQRCDNEHYELGEEVLVVMQKSLGWIAVLISYIFPLIILIILLLSLPTFQIPQIYTGLLSLLGMALYYWLVYIFRDRLTRNFIFKIEKTR